MRTASDLSRSGPESSHISPWDLKVLSGKARLNLRARICCPLSDGTLCCSGACQTQCGSNKNQGPKLSSEIACYKFPSSHNQNYDLLKVLSEGGQLVKVKLQLANSEEVIVDQNPVVSEYYLEPICHGTLSGRWLCTSRKNVPLYLNFEKGIVESLHFRDPLHVGVIRFVGDKENIEVREVSCF